MRKMPVLLVLGLAGLVVASLSPAAADVTTEFFSGGDASAGWVAFSPPPPGSTENASIALAVNGTSGSDFDDYAGVEFLGAPTAAPSAPPSFAFWSTATNAGSGGSPRLVIAFTDGGNMQLRPLHWTAGVWVTIDGAGGGVSDTDQGWDNSGGTCGFLYNSTYATALACHTGASVSGLFIVSDSGWFNPGGYVHYIDDVAYGDVTISAPTSCAEDFTGSHETGLVSAPVHGVVEPVADVAALGPTVHGINCDVVVPLGL